MRAPGRWLLDASDWLDYRPPPPTPADLVRWYPAVAVALVKAALDQGAAVPVPGAPRPRAAGGGARQRARTLA